MSLINAVTYAGIADARQAAAVDSQFLLLAAAREQLPQHPVIQAGYKLVGFADATNVFQVPVIGLDGYDRLQAVANGVEIENTALSTSSFTVTVGRFGKAYGAEDLARATDAQGILNAPRFALDAIASRARTQAYLLHNVVDDFTAQGGTAGAVLTVPLYQAAVYALDAVFAGGPKLAMLALKQWYDLQAYMTANAGGAIQYSQSATAIIEATGGGSKGNLLGADVWVGLQAPTKNSGVDVAGAIMVPGAVAMAEAMYQDDQDADQLLIGTAADKLGQVGYRLLVERDRERRAGITSWISQTQMGFSKAYETCGISIISKAT